MESPDPPAPRLRVSDVEREQVAQLLHRAHAEGRLGLAELDDRLRRAYHATFDDELRALAADLPAAAVPQVAAVDEVVELVTKSGTLQRTGAWVVPRVLRVSSNSGFVDLDMTNAVVRHPVVDVELAVKSGTTRIQLPPGASINVDQLTTDHGSVRSRKVSAVPEPGALHVRVSGHTKSGHVMIRYGKVKRRR